jgi:hypothetical protein
MVTCYTAIRSLTANSFSCKSLDFQGFTAAATLMLSLHGPNSRKHLSQDDWLTVGQVMAILKHLTMGQPSDKLATRGLSVLSTLTDVAMGPYPMHLGTSEGRRTGRVKVEIPYFCTVFFDRRIWVDHTDDASAPPPPTQSTGLRHMVNRLYR